MRLPTSSHQLLACVRGKGSGSGRTVGSGCLFGTRGHRGSIGRITDRAAAHLRRLGRRFQVQDQSGRQVQRSQRVSDVV